MSSAKCYLLAEREKNIKKHAINGNLAGFVAFFFLVSYISVRKYCKDI